MSNKLWISEPDEYHDNYGIHYQSNDPIKIIQFRTMLYETFINQSKFRTLHCENHHNYQYFEFKCKDKTVLSEILNISEKIAKLLQEKIEIGG